MAEIDVGHWTYCADFTLARDRVRLAIGDIQAADQLVADEEIAYWVTATGSENAAAIRACEHLAARFAREADETTTDTAGNSRSKSLSQRASGFLKIAGEIRRTGALATAAMPYAGGISQTDVDAQNADTDRVAPAFTIGMTDYT